MRINHNMGAVNTYSRLTSATAAQSKSLAKLSSGLRINNAADDAAGLAISEKMRGQIRGLDQAQRNSQDAISMIQTAEGGLSETHSILQRMRELAVQASNDTNTTSDRSEIQKEINQLTTEINRIGSSTEFNTKKLLNGELASTTSVSGATVASSQTASNATQAKYTIVLSSALATGDTLVWDGVSIGAVSATGQVSSSTEIVATDVLSTSVARVVGKLNEEGSFNANWIATDNGDGSFTIVAKAAGGTDGTDGNGKSITADVTTASTIAEVTAVSAVAQEQTLQLASAAVVEGLKITIDNKVFALWDSSAGTYANEAAAKAALGADYVYNIANSAYDTATEIASAIGSETDPAGAGVVANTTGQLTITATVAGTLGAAQAGVTVTGGGTSSSSGSGVTLQVGANADQSFTIYFEKMDSTGIDISSTTSGSTHTTDDSKTAYYTSSGITNGSTTEYTLDVSSSTKATAAISAIDDAIKEVSAERSKLGAYQNRLEHTINNLGTSSENLTAAESRIRDVDMAKEMMEFTKNNILNQAATAMLAQANQQPQGVLQLLR